MTVDDITITNMAWSALNAIGACLFVTSINFLLTALIIFAILFIKVALKLVKFNSKKINGNYCLRSTARVGKQTQSATQGCLTTVRAAKLQSALLR